MEGNKLLEERVEHLEGRVCYLEEQLQMKKNVVPIQETTQHMNRVEKKPIEWDVLIFQKVLPPIFIVVFIIGILWGFKAVSDYGVLTGPVKVLLGFIVAFALIGLGLWQLKQNRKNLGQMLLGGAIPILMLSTFAMHQLYSMTGPNVSFLLNIFWISLGLYFTYKYKSEGIGIVSTVGGVFVPFLIQSTSSNIPVFSFYEAILFSLFLWIALRYGYKVLFYVSVVFLQIALLVFFGFMDVPDELKWIVVLPIFVQHGALLFGLLMNKQILKEIAYTLFSVMGITILWVATIFTENEASIIIATIGVLYGICLYKYLKDIIRAPIFIANVSLALLYILQLQIEDLFFEGLIGLSLVSLFVYKKFHNILHATLSGIMYTITLFFIFNQNMVSWISWEMLHWLVLLAITGYGVYKLDSYQTRKDPFVYNWGIPYFAGILLYFLSLISTLLGDGTGSNLERVVMNGLWIVTAILFMLFSRKFSIQQGKYVGVGILFFTLAKIILFDVPFVSLAIKALLFIVLGVVGLLVSRVYYKKVER